MDAARTRPRKTLILRPRPEEPEHPCVVTAERTLTSSPVAGAGVRSGDGDGDRLPDRRVPARTTRARAREPPAARGADGAVLGTPALFATAYGNVGSSIYYALGLTAVYALGLTPLVFVIAGDRLRGDGGDVRRGTVRFPRRAARRASRGTASTSSSDFGAGWAQILVYIVTIATSAFFVPHYLSIFWSPSETNPWDIVGGAIVIVVLVALNVVGVTEAAKLSIGLAVIDFAHAGAARAARLRARLQPRGARGQRPLGHRADVGEPRDRDPGRDARLHRRRDRLEPRRGGARAGAHRPDAYKLVALAVFAIYFTLPLIALSALPVKEIDGELTTLLALPPEQGGFANDPILGVVDNLGLEGGAADRRSQLYVGVLAATILFIATNAGIIGASRITYSMSTLPADAGGLPAAPSAAQDAVHRARPVRRDRADRRSSCRAT